MPEKPKENIFEGSSQVCCHEVEWWYDLEDLERTPRLEKVLEEHAEERAKKCITEGYRRAELNCLYVEEDRTTDHEVRGSWSIVSP